MLKFKMTALGNTVDNIAGVIGGLTGKVFYAKKSTDSDYGTFKDEKGTYPDDGKAKVYPTIQEAINACRDSLGDIVVVCPGKWTEQSYIVGKDALKIVAGTRGWENQMRPGDAATNYSFTPGGGTAAGGASFMIMSRNVEITGFLFDGGGGYTGVYVGDGDVITGLGYTNKNSGSCWIHHNVFRGGSEGQYGIVLDGSSANGLIENNIFERHTAASVYVGGYSSRSNQQVIIRDNEFYAGNASYGVYVYSISGGNVGTLIKGNSFRDGSSLAFTYAVCCNGAGVSAIVGNWFACANTLYAQTTDWTSGNFYGNAGSATEKSNVFVDEETGTELEAA